MYIHTYIHMYIHFLDLIDVCIYLSIKLIYRIYIVLFIRLSIASKTLDKSTFEILNKCDFSSHKISKTDVF